MLKDSVYLVTGGASGLGRATVELLYNEGAKVVICDVDKSDFIKDPKRVIEFQIDVRSEADVKMMMEAVKQKFDKLNGIINCAGTAVTMPTYNSETGEPHNLASFQDVINVNVVGTFNVIRLGVPLMINAEPNNDKERGVIINTSSVLGRHGMKNYVAYCASKGAIISMTVPLAKELAQYGIRVIDIAPGQFYTNLILKVGLQNLDKYLFPARWAQPSEFANIVKLIIENPYLNGTTIEVDAAAFK